LLELLTPRVWNDIRAIASGNRHPAHVAVAYFGDKGDTLLPLRKGSSLVVDASIATVAGGSTSPRALERMRRKGARIFTIENLHAKVYAFRDVAFVGSANTSQRSERTLLEAVLRVDDKATVRAARGFVESLCLNELTGNDLTELATYYSPPTRNVRIAKQTKFSTLLMELTHEQGGSRVTQVQPPRPVWQSFFGLDLDEIEQPLLSLVHEFGSQRLESERHIVKHHHNYTIELPGAELPRPAILQMRRIDVNRYAYRVHRPKDKTFATIDNLLQTAHNPLRHSGRLWTVL
jgi:hypothetical protein